MKRHIEAASNYKTVYMWGCFGMPVTESAIREIRATLTNFRETAKLLEVPPKRFVSFLLDKKYIYRDKKGKLLPCEARNDGIFEIKECFNEKTKWSGTQTLVTPKGRETFRLLFVGAR